MDVLSNDSYLDYLQLNSSGNGTESSEDGFCKEWPGASLPYFQVANVFHLAAFVVPHNFKASALIMRSTLCIGQIMFMLWAAVNICAVDIFTWNLALTLVNLSHAIYLAVNIWPPLIPDNIKDLYTKLFLPLKVNRREFRCLTKEAEVKWLEEGEAYATEELTPSNTRLSILLKGKLEVTCDSTYLHYIFPNQFIDSAEWESSLNGNSDNLFQVSLVAVERSQFLTWSQPKLKQMLQTKPFLRAIIHCLIGKDITMKLYSLNEYRADDSKVTDLSKVGDLLKENLMQRSHSADTVHMGSKGFVRSNVWVAQKADPEMSSIGGSPSTKRSAAVGVHPNTSGRRG